MKIKYTEPCKHCPRDGQTYYRSVRVNASHDDEKNLLQKIYVYLERGKCPKCQGKGVITKIQKVFSIETIGKEDPDSSPSGVVQ